MKKQQIFPSVPTALNMSILLSPGTGTSPTGGEGWVALESLLPGDQLPRSKQEVEAAGEEDATTGAKASVSEENERTQKERGMLPHTLRPETNGHAVDVPG